MGNGLALSALLSPSMNAGLWVVAIVLLVVYVMRRRSRKEKEPNSLR
jgi:hypothetical protein